jgi:dTMP kinase
VSGGRLIAFEGGEACGKSTQARLLAAALDALLTREPGGTPLGEAIRGLLLDPASGPVDARAEALLMVADRAHHVREVIRPALERGRHVVTDRFSGSTIAYQGHARGLGPDEIARLCGWATDGLWPDLVVLLEVPLAVARQRLGGLHDRLEAEDDAFHEAVAAGFRAQAATDPQRWVVLDGTAPEGAIAEAVRAVVADRLGC